MLEEYNNQHHPHPIIYTGGGGMTRGGAGRARQREGEAVPQGGGMVLGVGGGYL